MQDILDEGLRRLKKSKTHRTRMTAMLLLLSLLVSLDVFWVLRQPGLTLAGDADCGVIEHTHDADCSDGDHCSYQEHIHSIDCYSDNTADIETPLEWQAMFDKYPLTGNLRQDILSIAKTQVGYTESTANFRVDNDGTRRGYSRYGDWYGTPYSEWSAIFVSFCLNAAKADVNEFPQNSGASSMAALWDKNGRYAAVGEYTPVSGDLVFFTNNTVGIVAEVFNATFYVICGDMDDGVSRKAMSLSDAAIKGWGVTGDVTQKDDSVSESLSGGGALGPEVHIYEGAEQTLRMTRYTRRSMMTLANDTVTDLVTYLATHKGNYFFTLLDDENHKLPTDANGNYIVSAETAYKLTLGVSAPEGFLVGSYRYKLPDGLLVDGGTGSFILQDGTNVGGWEVTNDGTLTMTFNDNINDRTDITISASMGVFFQASDDEIDFDGKITVVIEKPPEGTETTFLEKWGVQGVEGQETQNDPSKIYWKVHAVGKKDSNIPGSVLTDRVTVGAYLGEHYYSESDMAAGITFGAGGYDESGTYLWHSWTVYPGDPNLTWTENGWTYRMPERAPCIWCGDGYLGNEGWEYYAEYTSTPKNPGVAGSFAYMNHVTLDHKGADGWVEFVHGESLAEIIKTGSFVADADGGFFSWEVQTTIPGRVEGEKSAYFWYLMDYMDIRAADGTLLGYIDNDAHLATVTATYNGTTVNVPKIQDATDDDMFAWEHYWSADHNDGIYYGRQLNLVCRCCCTEESCVFWNNGKCASQYYYMSHDGKWTPSSFCQCWALTDPTTFTFSYKTDDLEKLDGYGGHGNKIRNQAVLNNHKVNPDGSTSGVAVKDSQKLVNIPGLFEKTLVDDFDGHTAKYKITVNEGKMVLTDGSPLLIHDVMTESLVYISGSMVITAEDANGNVTELHLDKDYTITYDGTGDKTDEQGNPVHVLDIVILHPMPVMYTLDYDATLIVPDNVTEGIPYYNTATVTLWGSVISDSTTETVYANINIAAKSYQVELHKLSAMDGKYLAGATLGLFNEHGGLIASATTDGQGIVLFKTNVIEGIILREHVLYYIQELEAPPGYRLDDTKHWFCFCSGTGDYCEEFTDEMAEKDTVRIPFKEVGHIHIMNEPLNYNLPATGGVGIYPLILVSVTFIVTPLVYGYTRRRKREGRGDG